MLRKGCLETPYGPSFVVMILATLGLLAGNGCMRMDVLPTADPTIAAPISQPRPFDEFDYPTEKDPTHVYRIGVPDVLRVDVRKDPTLGGTYPVTDEGYILLPNIGSIHVEDMTAQEVEAHLNQVLSEYIREPEVKVGIQEYLSKKVYMLGQINRGGPVVMQADRISLEEAYFEAGMHTDRAALSRTLIVRPDEENPVVYEVDLTDLIYKGQLDKNILLQPNDRVYIPSRYATNLRAVIQELLGPIEEVNRARSRVFFSDEDYGE